MHQGKYVFAQVMEHLHLYRFDQCVERYGGHRYVKTFSCREQFLALSFGQLAYRESLRDVITCLSAQKSKAYHLGFKTLVTRSTLAEANEKRDWRMYWDFAQVLIAEARPLYVNDTSFVLDLKNACYAIDSTSIDLCLALFPWAHYTTISGAIKMHTVMDLRGSIPTCIYLTTGKVNDVKFLDRIVFEKDAFYIMDRGYLDYARLHTIHTSEAFFVTRAKHNTLFERRYSHKVDKAAGMLCDQVILLTGKHAPQKYPDTLRRIKYRDAETGKVYVFLTNSMSVSAQTIADLYKHRWQIELFFKWIKQHLKIKVFWGQSENAVKTQICVALCTYLIVAILKKKLKIGLSIYEILQILSVSLFDKTPLVELFSEGEVQKDVKGSENMALLLGF
jgi:hypothetical protein